MAGGPGLAHRARDRVNLRSYSLRPMQIQPPPPLPIHVYLMNQPEAPWYLRPDWWVAGGTILLAIVTGMLAWYTYRLFAAAKEAREDSLKSLVAAEKTADASYQSAEAYAARSPSVYRFEGHCCQYRR